jgi:hypothetical protein
MTDLDFPRLGDLSTTELADLTGLCIAELTERLAALRAYEERTDAQGRALLTAQEPHATNPNTQTR